MSIGRLKVGVASKRVQSGLVGACFGMSYLYDDPSKFEGLGAPPSVIQAKVEVSLSAPSLGFETEFEGSQVLPSAPSLGCETGFLGAMVWWFVACVQIHQLQLGGG